MNWQDIHDQAIVFDWHNHGTLKNFLFDRSLDGKDSRFLTRLFKRSFWPLSERNTLPKMEEGGLNVVLSTSYIPEIEWVDDQKLIKFLKWLYPSVNKRVFQPTYFDATNAMMDRMEKEVESYGDKFKFVKSLKELEDAIVNSDIAMIHSVEGGHSLNGELAKKRVEESTALKPLVENELLKNLEHFYDRGVAYLTLAHFYPNHLVSPVFPYPEYGIKKSNWKNLMAGWDMNKGLTSIGKKVVEAMKDMGMIIDITHCTPKARSEVYDIVGNDLSKVVASHIGAFSVNPDPLNLEDWEIKWLADHNCLIGIIFMNYWLSPIDTGLGLKYIEKTIDHIINVAGDEVLAIGTDFDGFTDPPDEITDISELPRLTRYLKCFRSGVGEDKYSNKTIANILGRNSLRFILEGWGKKK
jgi:microsomal dipeptidase-like Zn-dependent dipeptidase